MANTDVVKHNLKNHGRQQFDVLSAPTVDISNLDTSILDAKTGRYDGVHFYGPNGFEAYTQSVKNILSSAQLTISQVKPTTEGGTAQDKNHINCAQAKFQKKYHPSVVTQNRFGVFNQGNF